MPAHPKITACIYCRKKFSSPRSRRNHIQSHRTKRGNRLVAQNTVDGMPKLTHMRKHEAFQ